MLLAIENHPKELRLLQSVACKLYPSVLNPRQLSQSCFKGCCAGMQWVKNGAAGWFPHEVPGVKDWPGCHLPAALGCLLALQKVEGGPSWCHSVGPSFLGRVCWGRTLEVAWSCATSRHICCQAVSLHSTVLPSTSQIHKKYVENWKMGEKYSRYV